MEVHITQYKWEGSWGPFKIQVPCGECSATEGVIKHVIDTRFPGAPIAFEAKPWLDNWWEVLWKGGWHAPITLVNGRVISQGAVLDAGLLAYHIRKELVKGFTIPDDRNVMYTKPGCSYCLRAKDLFTKHGMLYEERDIVRNPLYAHELFFTTSQFFPKNKPVTTPQIWLGGTYLGGAEDLEAYFQNRD